MSRTIFITSFHPLISRNILQTDVLKRISSEMQVVLVVPSFKKGYFERTFAVPGHIFVEGVSTELTRKDLFMRKVFLAISNTRGLYIKKRSKLHEDKRFFSFLFSIIPAFIVSRARLLVGLLRRYDAYVLRGESYDHLFDRYKPVLVFSTDVQNEQDVLLMRAAKRNGAKVIGMVRSWDNLTSKGTLRTVPDILVVNNDIIRREAESLNFISPDKINVVGIPHYDQYVHAQSSGKEAFYGAMGLKSNKPLILYAPVGNRYVQAWNIDLQVLNELAKLDVNILVRLPPGDTFDYQGFVSTKAHVVFDKPGQAFETNDIKVREISPDDERRLIDSLTYCDLLVTGHSTISVDAVAFDRPVVLIRFEQPVGTYWDGVRRYYDFEYFDLHRSSGGVRFADSVDQLTGIVRAYLEDPSLDKEGRQQLADGLMQYRDGASSRRLAQLLLKESII